jgi:hypothetical protein
VTNTASPGASRSSDQTASKLQCSATLRPVGGRAAGRDRSATRSSITTWAKRQRQRRIIREELEPAEADAVREAVSRVLKGESLRSIAFDFNKRGIKPAGGKKNGESKIDKWQGSTCGAC